MGDKLGRFSWEGYFRSLIKKQKNNQIVKTIRKKNCVKFHI